MRKFAVLLAALAVAGPAPAGEKNSGAEGRARAVGRFLDDQAVAIAHVDITRVDVEVLVNRLAEAGKVDRAIIARDMAGMRHGLAAFVLAGVRDIYFVFSLADLQHMPFAVMPLREGDDGKAVREFLDKEKVFPNFAHA